MMHDQARWNQLWFQLCSREPNAALWSDLSARYSEPQRAYHNLAHIRDCLVQFDLVRDQFERPMEAELALWAHDVIYDSYRTDNELLSADWVAGAMQAHGIAEDSVNRVTSMILDTRHQSDPLSSDAARIVDIDLSILGREPEVFQCYHLAIRREYDWVNEAAYQEGRIKVLTQFLNRPFLYHTHWFRTRYEAAARKNLMDAIHNFV